MLEHSIKNYYSNRDPDNNGELIINQIKEFDKGYLVIAEKYRGDGHSFDDLFLLDNTYQVTKKTSGCKPLSPCFSVKMLYYNNKTILFGSFSNTKWVPKTDTKVEVDIKKMYIEFENGKKVNEKVNIENGYLIFLDGEQKIKKIELYDDNSVLQAELDETIVVNADLLFSSIEK